MCHATRSLNVHSIFFTVTASSRSPATDSPPKKKKRVTRPAVRKNTRVPISELDSDSSTSASEPSPSILRPAPKGHPRTRSDSSASEPSPSILRPAPKGHPRTRSDSSDSEPSQSILRPAPKGHPWTVPEMEGVSVGSTYTVSIYFLLVPFPFLFSSFNFSIYFFILSCHYIKPPYQGCSLLCCYMGFTIYYCTS